MIIAHLQLLSPTKEKRTVMPLRLPNHELRPREHLTEREVERLIEAAKKNRHRQRDAAIILIASATAFASASFARNFLLLQKIWLKALNSTGDVKKPKLSRPSVAAPTD